jgi:hypothetical protein
VETSLIENRQSCVANVRHRQGPHYGNEPNLAADVAEYRNGKPNDESRANTVHSVQAGESDAGSRLYMTATDLETHLVRAIVARTGGRIQALRIQILGERTVLHGFSDSYYAIQLAVAGLMETLNALGLDKPGRVDLNIDIIPSHPPRA